MSYDCSTSVAGGSAIAADTGAEAPPTMGAAMKAGGGGGAR